MNTLGSVTESLFIKGPKAHTLHHEFEVKASTTVYEGQPVKLYTDGTIEPLADGDAPTLMVGIAIHEGTDGELVTVATRGMAIVKMEIKADSHVAGPVSYDAYNSTTGLVEVDDASVDHTNHIGWGLGTGDNGDTIEVLILG